jgi:hypothetical protein
VPLLAAYITLGLNPASLLLALALDALEGSSAAKLGQPPAVVFHSCHLCTLAWAAVSSAEPPVSSAEPAVSSLVLPLIRIAHAALLGTNTAPTGTNTALHGAKDETAPEAAAQDGSGGAKGLDPGSSAAKLGHGSLLDLSSAPIWRAVRKTEATAISRELACHADDV